MSDFDWKGIVGSVAPILGTALGGPFGGMAVKAIGDALGLSAATEKTVAAALSGATPEDLLKLKQADQDFATKMKQADVDLEKVAAQDRDSARKASVEGGTSRDLFWLSLFLLSVCLGAELGVLFFGYPAGSSELVVGRVLGLMDAVAMVVLSFNYGTTKTSQTKDTTISNMAAK